ASPSLATDVTGDYVVRVTAMLSNAPPTSTTATVHAVAAPVFYVRLATDPNGGEVAVHTSGHDGSDEHAVACAISVQASESSAYLTRTMFAAATAMDIWEAPPGQGAHFVFAGTSSTKKDDAGDFDTFLIAGTTGNSCTKAPNTVRHAQAPQS